MINWLPFSFLFTSLMVFGTLFSVSSPHWLSAWIGLEINLIGFLTMLMFRGLLRETESGVKYLIIQSLGSGLLLTSILIMLLSAGNFNIMDTTLFSNTKYMIMLALFLKLGAAPMHFWLPSTMAGMSWVNCMFLATWQKIAPLILLLTVANYEMNLTLLAASIGAIVGGIGGLNQTHTRALLAYSSIIHLSWMLASSMFNYYTTMTYMMVYLLTTTLLFTFLLMNDISQTQQFSTNMFMDHKQPWMFIMLMLSLAGMPPLLGFLGKWLVIFDLMMYNYILLLLVLIIGSMMSLFYYLSLSFAFLLNMQGLSSPHMITAKQTTALKQPSMVTLTMMTLFGFIIILPLMSISNTT
uniref:NADH-ubiquinone oxidoreductase chain 2 n=1 Tax=Nucula nucleus TaxID=47129 RepID=D3G6E6_9BIVA|nr:NADH dehydrogenase subunit 2 [Nucula nucleus]